MSPILNHDKEFKKCLERPTSGSRVYIGGSYLRQRYSFLGASFFDQIDNTLTVSRHVSPLTRLLYPLFAFVWEMTTLFAELPVEPNLQNFFIAIILNLNLGIHFLLNTLVSIYSEYEVLSLPVLEPGEDAVAFSAIDA